MIVCVELPRGVKREDFDPFPGDECAFDRGCTCPFQMQWPEILEIAVDCPIHELEKAPH